MMVAFVARPRASFHVHHTLTPEGMFLNVSRSVFVRLTDVLVSLALGLDPLATAVAGGGRIGAGPGGVPPVKALRAVALTTRIRGYELCQPRA